MVALCQLRNYKYYSVYSLLTISHCQELRCGRQGPHQVFDASSGRRTVRDAIAASCLCIPWHFTLSVLNRSMFNSGITAWPASASIFSMQDSQSKRQQFSNWQQREYVFVAFLRCNYAQNIFRITDAHHPKYRDAIRLVWLWQEGSVANRRAAIRVVIFAPDKSDHHFIRRNGQ